MLCGGWVQSGYCVIPQASCIEFLWVELSWVSVGVWQFKMSKTKELGCSSQGYTLNDNLNNWEKLKLSNQCTTLWPVLIPQPQVRNRGNVFFFLRGISNFSGPHVWSTNEQLKIEKIFSIWDWRIYAFFLSLWDDKITIHF